MDTCIAVVAPLLAMVLGAAMAVRWELGDDGDLSHGAPGMATIGAWMAEHLPLMRAGKPVWAWRGPFFVSLLLAVPFAWKVTGRVHFRAARCCTRLGLLVATGAVALEYNTAGYGWLFDLAALLVTIGGTVACSISGLRRRTLPARSAWALVSALPHADSRVPDLLVPATGPRHGGSAGARGGGRDAGHGPDA